jgi:hypothetical protein
MTTYYLSSVDGSDASDGLSWDNAYATFKYAVETASAVASGPHTLLVDSAHNESLSAATTITAAGNINVLCVNRTTGALATGATVGAQATSYAITYNGAFHVYTSGITLKLGTGTENVDITLNSTDGGYFVFENCTFIQNNNAGAEVAIGSPGTAMNGATLLKGCAFTFAHAGNGIQPKTKSTLVNCSGSGTSPTNLFEPITTCSGAVCLCDGCDWSFATGNVVRPDDGAGTCEFTFRNCKFGVGATIFPQQTTVSNPGGTTVTAYNCSAGDTHYAFFHRNPFGQTNAVVTYYCDDGATDQNNTNISYSVVTSATCSYYTPYEGPWIAKPHTGTAAVTPSFEGLRVNSTTVIQDDEVWGEWSYQGTSGSTQASFVSDRMTPLGTAANQTSSKTYADWTGSPTDTDSGDSVFKLAPASAITPAEVGHIMGRVVVGEPSMTIYYDPQIRVA